MRVLVVSEDAKERMRAWSALRLRADAEVVEATTAWDARKLIGDEDFDVLVIDGDLSPKGGFSMLYELREQAEMRGEQTPPALVMMGREDDRWLAGWAGFNEVMLKPVDSFVLARRVSGLAGEAAAPAGADGAAEEVEAILEGAEGEDTAPSGA